MKKLIAVLLVIAMMLGVLAGCKDTDTTTKDTYTYNTYMAALATNWNPHTWENSADSSVLSYIEAPLTDLSIKDSESGEYQWVFVAAESITDVTADHQDDLAKYGAAETDATEGYIYEIKLREGMCWQDGTAINADTYVYSMKQLLDPTMKNYRANLYYSGDSALAGASAYYFQGSKIFEPVVPAYGEGEEPDYSLDLSTVDVYVNVTTNEMTFAGYSFNEICNDYGYISAETYAAVADNADANGYVQVTDDNKEAVLTMMNEYCSAFGMTIYNEDGSVIEEYYKEFLFFDTGKVSDAVSFDTVGLYKVDDYTIRYVCQTAYDYYYFLTSCTSNWIVHEELYESCKEYDEESGLTTSTYGTSKEKTMSYGPYKITSLEDDKQMIFEQNETYFEYTADEDGNLTSTTEKVGLLVDGEYQPQYVTQKVIINVMTDDAAKLAFLAGDLDDWSLSAEDALEFSTSEQLYQVDETYTMRLFFHTNLESLKAMDAEGTNTNGVVLSNDNFRKAFSLAIDRSEYVSATAGFKPACFLLNYLYFYDVYEDPTSIYRNTDEAMQAICNMYGVEYGDGTAYATLEEAFNSITGYNLTEAQALMATACDELVAAGLYTEGDPIEIKLALTAGSADSADQQQVALLNQYLNAAVEGSGFGTITLTYVDNLTDRYGDVASGVYAIGRGAWGGAAFYPFNAIGCYTDAEYAGYIHEMGCWDPATENLTMTINGEEITMTYEAWSRSIKGTGEYANADASTKLAILAGLEENILEHYYCIPLCTYTACSMLSYKTSYYTENYSIMYGFGGLRLMKYNYTDAEWAEYVASQNGTLGY